MCPSTQRFYIMLAVFIAIAYFVYRRMFDVIAENFETLGAMLTGAQRKTTFFSSNLEGYYKSRKVSLSYPHFDKGPHRRLSMEPRNIPIPQKAFMISYPRPTPNTQWKGDKVYYSTRGIFVRSTDSYLKVFASEELVGMLEELSEAAQKVEAGIKPA